MKTCKDCIYLLLINSYTEDDGIRTYNGECRFFPDSVYVKSTYWCGQLKEKPNLKDELANPKGHVEMDEEPNQYTELKSRIAEGLGKIADESVVKAMMGEDKPNIWKQQQDLKQPDKS